MIPGVEQAWQESIRPTLTDLLGSAWFLSTPKGQNYFSDQNWRKKARYRDRASPQGRRHQISEICQTADSGHVFPDIE